VNPPESLAGALPIGGILIPTYSLFVILVGFVAFVALDVGIHRLWIGKVVQALVNDNWMIQLLVTMCRSCIRVRWFYHSSLPVWLAGFSFQTRAYRQRSATLLFCWASSLLSLAVWACTRRICCGACDRPVESVSSVVFHNFPGLSVYIAMVVMLLVRPQGLFGSAADSGAPSDWRALFRFGGLPTQVRALVAARTRGLEVKRSGEALDLRLSDHGGRRFMPYLVAVIVVGGLSVPIGPIRG